MGAAAQRLTDVGSQHADIGSLAAGNPQAQQVSGKIQAVDGMNGHRARRALDFDALARQFVQGAPVTLERGVHGRNLPDVADKARQHAENIAFGDVDRAPKEVPLGDNSCRHRPFGIAVSVVTPSCTVAT